MGGGGNLKRIAPESSSQEGGETLPLPTSPNLMRRVSMRSLKLQLDTCSLRLGDIEDLLWLLYGKVKGVWAAQWEQNSHGWSGGVIALPMTVSWRCTNPRVGESDLSNSKSFPWGPQRESICSRLLRDSRTALGWWGGRLSKETDTTTSREFQSERTSRGNSKEPTRVPMRESISCKCLLSTKRIWAS